MSELSRLAQPPSPDLLGGLGQDEGPPEAAAEEREAPGQEREGRVISPRSLSLRVESPGKAGGIPSALRSHRRTISLNPSTLKLMTSPAASMGL
jgi:hypothetical protein